MRIHRYWPMALTLFFVSSVSAETSRPNIVWIVSEDHGPHMGCFGDAFATTPNVDGLARKGVIYTHAWSNAPVCAPARTTIITGMYAPSTGSEHMRSQVPYPKGMKMFPMLLREAGYYCTNNSKEDYNIATPGKVWDESSSKAHWRKAADGQPFFAVFNSNRSHESRVRARPHKPVHDADKVRVPAYHPDTPEVRRDWAQYYDVISQADEDAGQRLRELEEAGRMEDTIIFYYADHGSGLPRNKRSACESGLHVPLVVYIPEKFRDQRPEGYEPGGKIDRLVAFVDFGPTVLSLAGVEPPSYMQGKPFLGAFSTPPKKYLLGYRGRMDERTDMVRSLTDGRYVYVRNFYPHQPHGQQLDYMFQTPTTRVWYDLFQKHQLNAAQSAYWLPKSPEELYDLTQDPDEIVNLAESEGSEAVLNRFRQELSTKLTEIRDVGFLPEGEMWRRSDGQAPFDALASDDAYPFRQILDAALLATRITPESVTAIPGFCSASDPAIRFWGAQGLLNMIAQGQSKDTALLGKLLSDPSPFVRIAAAEALGRFGSEEEKSAANQTLAELAQSESKNLFALIAGLQAIDAVGDSAQQIKSVYQKTPIPRVPHTRYSPYIPRLLTGVTQKPPKGKD